MFIKQIAFFLGLLNKHQWYLKVFNMVINEPRLIESENPPDLITISEADGVFFNEAFSQDRRLRRVVYEQVLAARRHLPDSLTFMIYEAYRPRARQVTLWEGIWTQMKEAHPQASDGELTALCDNFVANPHGVGSGHQFGCAVDITLCSKDGKNILDMGTALQEFCSRTQTISVEISPEQTKNRALLRDSLEAEGLINYPSEWWHFSYGDRLWAILTGRAQTMYGLLPF
jgi:D-alanyl-D-alanine dipeptidase